MANYTTGSVSVTKGSNIVTGKGTMWDSSAVEAGDLIVVAGGRSHTIASVRGNDSLSLETAYEGETSVDQAYSIAMTLDKQTVARVAEKVEQGREGGYSGSLSVIPEGMNARLGANAQSLIFGSLIVNGSYQVDGTLRVQD